MRFKIDENLPVAVAELCNELGHNTITVAEQSLGGKSDTEIATACRFEKRALVTLDVDFADIRTYPPEDFYGLIVLRLNNQAQPHVLEKPSGAFSLFYRKSHLSAVYG